MKLHRNFFQYSSEETISTYRMDAVRGKDGRAHLGLYTDFFDTGRGRIMRTNNEYLSFRNEVESTISNQNTIDPITIDVFELTESDEFDRETSIIGFKKFMGVCYHSYKGKYLARLTLFSFFLVIGLAMIFLLHTVGKGLPEWLFYCLETVATVFVWQFAGYVAFELLGEIRQLRRFRQIADVEFTFKKWE